MNGLWGIVILTVIMMFLICLALYRFYTIDKIEKKFKEQIHRLANSLKDKETECAKLRTFKYVTENYVTGERPAEQKVKLIKELLYR